jgi:hypothetical protein
MDPIQHFLDVFDAAQQAPADMAKKRAVFALIM